MRSRFSTITEKLLRKWTTSKHPLRTLQIGICILSGMLIRISFHDLLNFCVKGTLILQLVACICELSKQHRRNTEQFLDNALQYIGFDSRKSNWNSSSIRWKRDSPWADCDLITLSNSEPNTTVHSSKQHPWPDGRIHTERLIQRAPLSSSSTSGAQNARLGSWKLRP